MFPNLQRAMASPRPKKGVNADVLVDGLSPGAPRDLFHLDWKCQRMAYYLLEGDRGFRRIIHSAQFPPAEFITIKSSPAHLDQFRVAFGLTLIEDSKETGARMGLKVHMKDRTVGRFVQLAESSSCIRFLEVIEGVDDLRVKFRFRDESSGSVVSGAFFI